MADICNSGPIVAIARTLIHIKFREDIMSDKKISNSMASF